MEKPMRWSFVLAAGVAGLLFLPADAAKKGTFEADRAGWMLGLYVGEEKGKPYPFVLDIDKTSDAKKKGVRVGDEIISIEEMKSKPLKPLYEAANKLKPGKQITMWIRRGSQELMLQFQVPRDAGSATAEEPEKKPEEKKPKKKKPIVFKPIPVDP